MTHLVYYSSRSENTHRFVQKLGLPNLRIPNHLSESASEDDFGLLAPYVLVVPTYAGEGGVGAVPKPVIRFLNNPHHRSLLRGVIAAGNSNFGHTFGLAGKIISEKCHVPYLYRFELFGTDADILAVQEGILTQWIH